MAHVSTHVLDLTSGAPAAGVRIELFRPAAAGRELIRSTVTNRDGRTSEPLLAADRLPGGAYELVFHAGEYFQAAGVDLPNPAFLDEVVVRFLVDPSGGSYHVPLLLSPYGYSTYRGS